MNSSKFIPHNKPTVEKDDIGAVSRCLSTSLIAQGEKVAEFESLFSAMHKSRHAAAVNSGTGALHLALLALKIKKGDEVVIPSYACASLLNAVNYVGAKAVFADIDLDDFNISPADTNRKITNKTKAVIVPHLFGYPAKLSELRRLGIPVIEDCAQSIGMKIDGSPAGTFGDIAVFSFYATKMMTTCGEGGMVLTNSPVLNNSVRDLRDYDEKSAFKIRFNYKMTDVAASMGIVQLEKLNRFILKRKEISEIYNKRFSGKDFYIDRGNNRGNIYFRYLISVERNQGLFLKRASNEKIGIKRPIYTPLHRYFNLPDKLFPNTVKVWERTFSIPIYPGLSKKDAFKTASFLLEYFYD